MNHTKQIKLVLLTGKFCVHCKPMRHNIEKLFENKFLPSNCEFECVDVETELGCEYTKKNCVQSLPALLILEKDNGSINFSTKQSIIGLISANDIEKTIRRHL